MGAGDEDAQLEELEVLSSIFPDELEVVQAAAPRELRLQLVPHAPGGDENHVAITLVAVLPADYPSAVPPELTIEIQKGLGQKQRDELKALADKTASADVGVPVIFTVCEALKEWLCDNNVAGQDGSMYSEMLRREQKKDSDQKRRDEKKAISRAADLEVAEKMVDPEEEERIRRRQAGQPVTVESFNAWKAKFDEEMRAQAALFNGGQVPGEGLEARLTGKQLFLQNKAGLLDGDDLVASAENDEELGGGAEADEPSKRAAGGEPLFEDDDDDDDDEDWVPGEDEEDDDDDEDDEDFDPESHEDA